jgi:glycerophosphoryl diester phosphodiesterase
LSKKTQIWGHRGAYGHAPENTLKAFELALEMGADGVEFDVQMTKDGELVVIHDETIERTSNGTGEVSNFTLVELKRFNFNKRGLVEPLQMEIPTLREVLGLFAKTALVLNIELKTGIKSYPGIEARTIAAVREFGLGERVIYSSFNHYSVQRVKELEPQARVGLLFGFGHLCTAAAAQALGAEALHPDYRCLSHPGFVADCRARGIKIHAWTLNEERDIIDAHRLGIDAMVTNYPDRARMLLDTGNAGFQPAQQLR